MHTNCPKSAILINSVQFSITGDFYLQTNGELPFSRGPLGTRFDKTPINQALPAATANGDSAAGKNVDVALPTASAATMIDVNK